MLVKVWEKFLYQEILVLRPQQSLKCSRVWFVEFYVLLILTETVWNSIFWRLTDQRLLLLTAVLPFVNHELRDSLFWLVPLLLNIHLTISILLVSSFLCHPGVSFSFDFLYFALLIVILFQPWLNAQNVRYLLSLVN